MGIEFYDVLFEIRDWFLKLYKDYVLNLINFEVFCVYCVVVNCDWYIVIKIFMLFDVFGRSVFSVIFGNNLFGNCLMLMEICDGFFDGM